MLMLTTSATAEAARSTRYAKLDQFPRLGTAAKNNALVGLSSQSPNTTRSRTHLKTTRQNKPPKMAYKWVNVPTSGERPSTLQPVASTTAQQTTKITAAAKLRVAQK